MSTYKGVFFFLLLCGMAVGCTVDVNMPDQQTKPGLSLMESGEPLILSGQTRFNGAGMKDVRVLVVPEFGDAYSYYEISTDDHGDFQVAMDKPGLYSLLAEFQTNSGVMTAVIQKFTLVDHLDLGSLEMAFYNLAEDYSDQEPTDEDVAAQGQYGSVEQGLGVGVGCLRFGCSSGVSCYGGLKCLCCGYNICISGWELCVPYGR